MAFPNCAPWGWIHLRHFLQKVLGLGRFIRVAVATERGLQSATGRQARYTRTSNFTGRLMMHGKAQASYFFAM